MFIGKTFNEYYASASRICDVKGFVKKIEKTISSVQKWNDRQPLDIMKIVDVTQTIAK